MASLYNHIGIIVHFSSRFDPPFLEHGYYRYLSVYARQHGIVVTVFFPSAIDWEKRIVYGYRFVDQSWKKGAYPFPTLVYDRIFFRSSAYARRVLPVIERLQMHGVHLLGKGLPSKLKVYNMLKDHQNIRPHLPETVAFHKKTAWKSKLEEYGAVFLKPSSGTHGRGVIKVEKNGPTVRVQGRTYRNELFTKLFSSFADCDRWLKQQIQSRAYILQPYLALNTNDYTPFDLRVLMQKNEQGEWVETGKAIRKGKRKGLTSNLHGGGTAVCADRFLSKYYSDEQIVSINQLIQNINTHVPSELEKKHGPLLELGLDLGIENGEKVWLLEVNSKPGRKSFQISNRHTFLQSMSTPVRYATYVLQSLKGVRPWQSLSSES